MFNFVPGFTQIWDNFLFMLKSSSYENISVIKQIVNAFSGLVYYIVRVMKELFSFITMTLTMDPLHIDGMESSGENGIGNSISPSNVTDDLNRINTVDSNSVGINDIHSSNEINNENSSVNVNERIMESATEQNTTNLIEKCGTNEENLYKEEYFNYFPGENGESKLYPEISEVPSPVENNYQEGISDSSSPRVMDETLKLRYLIPEGSNVAPCPDGNITLSQRYTNFDNLKNTVIESNPVNTVETIIEEPNVVNTVETIIEEPNIVNIVETIIEEPSNINTIECTVNDPESNTINNVESNIVDNVEPAALESINSVESASSDTDEVVESHIIRNQKWPEIRFHDNIVERENRVEIESRPYPIDPGPSNWYTRNDSLFNYNNPDTSVDSEYNERKHERDYSDSEPETHSRRTRGSKKSRVADLPLAWGLYFQDGASPSFEGIVELHNRIMFYLVLILFGVTWVMLSIMINFNKKQNPIVYRYLNHGTLIELIWTVGPALVLVAIAFPSFKLLYLMDEVIDPAMTVKVTGHQWYWEYEYADFLNEENENIDFDSYMKDEGSLEEGELRLLDVDNPLVLPADTHIRFIITGADVIHDWALPSLGIKVDACPGRLNQASVIIERTGIYYGQCSEICGVLHSSMPIKLEAVEVEKFFSWVLEQ
jgi:cytochrome c oxidase subunit 2